MRSTLADSSTSSRLAAGALQADAALSCVVTGNRRRPTPNLLDGLAPFAQRTRGLVILHQLDVDRRPAIRAISDNWPLEHCLHEFGALPRAHAESVGGGDRGLSRI